MKTERDSKNVFGAEIQYFRIEPKYWETIVKRFKDTGLRCVTTYVQWGTHLVGAPDKANPAGKLDFTGKTAPQLDLLRFLDLVQKHGLDLNFRCGPFCCNEMPHGAYPTWLTMGDPNMMVWDYQNRTTQGYWIGKREGSQPSYLHPDYLAWCAKWIAEVDKVIAPRLKSKGGFITMLNLDNEISYIVKDSFLDSDYNPVNVRPGGFYHQFLAEKYGSAKALPYPKKYNSVEEVEPPRAVPESAAADFPYYADWVEFKTWAMCSYIKELRKMHESNGVKDVTFMTNFNPHLPEGVPTRMPAFEAAVGKGGMVGYDFYRGAFMSYSGYQSMARVLKLMNATVGYTWSAEFMSGTWNKDLSKASRVSDDHMRFMARCALAQGCKAIDWFMFHDRDCWGDAPVSGHGHPRPSLEVLRETVDILFNRVSNWDKLIPRTDVAIVYDLPSHVHTAIGDPMPCADNDNYVGKPLVEGVQAGKASVEYYGLFRLVEQAGAQAGVVDTVHSNAKLADYKLALLPGSPVVAAATSSALEHFVKNGGTLLVSGVWPTLDETGKKINFLGKKASRGGPAALGSGTVVWKPDYLAQAAAEADDLASIAFVANWIEKSGTVPAVKLSVPTLVEWRDWQAGGGHGRFEQPRNLGSAVLHEAKGEKVLFVLNHYIMAAEFELEFSDAKVGKLVNLSTGETIPVKGGKASVDLDRKTVEIYKVQ